MKIIIDIRDNISTTDALMKVSQVIDGGRCSNDGKNYCWLTAWNDGVNIYSKRNKQSDTFTVYKRK